MNDFSSISLILICLTAYSVGLFTVTFRVQRTRKRLNQQITAEKTRSYFADLRLRLQKLVSDRILSADSATFRIYYGLFTTIMRRPDQYDKIANAIFLALIKYDGSEKNPFMKLLEQEKETWSDDIKKLLTDTGTGLSLLIIDHSVPLRLLRHIWDKTNQEVTASIEQKIKNYEIKKNPSSRKIFEGIQTLKELAA
jgi:hypothetical protein